MIEVVPTIVPDSLADVRRMCERYESFLSLLHVDIADGVFAPNKTWVPKKGERLPNTERIRYQAHLMVKDQRSFGVLLAHSGAKEIEGHLEAFNSSDEGLEIFDAWREAGAEKVGIALLLQTPLETVSPYIDAADYVRLMTIPRIGTQGIPFDEKSITRVAEFRERYPGMTLAVDGGVSEKNIQALARAGATCFTAGSAIARSKDPMLAYDRLISLAEAGV